MIWRLSLLLLLLPCCSCVADDSTLPEALTWYRQGELAESVAEREIAFNRALNLYAQAETGYSHRPGPLLYNIANCYYHLGEYPWAILYYEKALEQMPRNKKIQFNLHLARKKAGVPQENMPAWLQKVTLSHVEKMLLFSLLLVCAAVLASVALWSQSSRYAILAKVTLALACLPLISAGFSYFLGDIRAVVVQSTPLYRDAGAQYAPLTVEPIVAGSTVQVLDVERDGQWLQIQIHNQSVGFVPYETVRII